MARTSLNKRNLKTLGANASTPKKNAINSSSSINIDRFKDTKNQGVFNGGDKAVDELSGQKVLDTFKDYKAPVADFTDTKLTVTGPNADFTTNDKNTQNYLSQKQTLDTVYDKEQKNISDMQKEAESKLYRDTANTLGSDGKVVNLNEVTAKVNAWDEAAGKYRIDNGITGELSEQQVYDIGKSLGLNANESLKYAQGKGFEDLQLSDAEKARLTEKNTQGVEDATTKKKRSIEDLNFSVENANLAIDNQIADVTQQYEQNKSMYDMRGALTGGNRSSGFVVGMQNLKNDFNKVISRLSAAKETNTEEGNRLAQRIIDDYTLNLERNTKELNDSLNQYKVDLGNAINTNFLNYAPTDEALTRKLESLNDKYGILSQNAFTNYLSNLQGIKDNMFYDTDKMLEYQKATQDLQQTTLNNLYQENGAALAGMTSTDIDALASQGFGAETITMLKSQQSALGLNTLKEYGIPTPTDVRLYDTLLSKGYTPNMAMSAVIQNNPTNYKDYDSLIAQAKLDEAGKDSTTDSNIGKTVNLGDGKILIWDTESQSYKLRKGEKEYTPVGEEEITKGKEWLSNQKVGSNGGSCGHFTNNYLENMGLPRKFGNETIETRKERITDTEPVDGAMILYDFTNAPEGSVSDDGRKYGHVGVVWKDDNGEWMITDSNSLKDGKKNTIETDKLKLDNPYIAGYIMPSKEDIGNVELDTNYLDTVVNNVINKGVTLQNMESELSKEEYAYVQKKYNERQKDIGFKYVSNKDIQSRRDELRKEINDNDSLKAFITNKEKTKEFFNIMSSNNGPAELANVFSFMKSLDETSVVRESEYEKAAGSLGVWAGLKNKVEQRQNGGSELSDDEKYLFYQVVEKVHNNKKDTLYNELQKTLNVVESDFDMDNMSEKQKNEFYKYITGYNKDEIEQLKEKKHTYKSDNGGLTQIITKDGSDYYKYIDENGNKFEGMKNGIPHSNIYKVDKFSNNWGDSKDSQNNMGSKNKSIFEEDDNEQNPDLQNALNTLNSN